MASELVKVPFYGDELDAVRNTQGVILVSLRRCCDNLGLDFSTQLRKLRSKSWASVVEMTTQMPGSDQPREVTMVDLETLPGWLFSIDARKVAEHVVEKLARYQREAARVLANHFLRPTANTVTLTADQFERLIGRVEHLQQQLDRLSEQRTALPVHIPTSATPRTTVQERLRFKGWPQATKKQRAVVRRQANIWLDLRYNETPDVSGGPGGACLYFGHQIVVLDEAIDYVRDAVANRGRDAKRYRNGDLVNPAA